MLGSVSDADDAVQEAWLRLNRSDTSVVRTGDMQRLSTGWVNRSVDAEPCGSWTYGTGRAQGGVALAYAARDRAAFRSEAPQLVRVADRVDPCDATVADDERERRAMAVAARKDQPEPPVELDLDRVVRGLAADRHPRARDPRPATQRLARGSRAAAPLRRPDDIRVEHRDKALEVALGDCLRERSHGAIVLVARGREARALALDVTAGARGELPHRLGRAADHLGDVAERHVEHVVQHERRALRGRELLEHGQQRVADRLVERDVVRRVVRHVRLREPRTDVGLAARASGLQA